MLRGVFVTGTDTGVGKTVTCAALLLRYRHVGALRYWKPIQTGIEQDDDTRSVDALAGACVLDEGVRLPRPLSPHLAARLSGSRIDVDTLLAIASAQPETDRFIVEGAGGVLVPINQSSLMIDFMQALGLPAVIVARSTLGTINHTLLTVEALRARRVPVAGVVLNGPANPENRAAIEEFGGVEVLGAITTMESLTGDTLARQVPAIDPDGRLEPVFGP